MSDTRQFQTYVRKKKDSDAFTSLMRLACKSGWKTLTVTFTDAFNALSEDYQMKRQDKQPLRDPSDPQEPEDENYHGYVIHANSPRTSIASYLSNTVTVKSITIKCQDTQNPSNSQRNQFSLGREGKIKTEDTIPPGYFDILTVTLLTSGYDADKALKLTAQAREEFEFVDTQSYLGYLSEGDQSFAIKRDDYLARQEGLIDKMQEQVSIATTKVTESMLQHTAKLDAIYEEKHAKLETDKAKWEEKVAQDKEELAKLKSAIAEMANRDLRIKTGDDFKKELKNLATTFDISWTTRKKSWWILGGFALLIGVFLYGAYAFVIKDQSSTLNSGKFDWVIVVRELFLVFGFATATSTFILWSIGNYNSFAKRELKFQQMGVDIVRASWLVELALEWKKSVGEHIPNVLTERFSRELFTDTEAKEEDHKSIDLLKATELKVSNEGFEASFNKKDLKKATEEKDKEKS
ncbi:MAG: hypothetical protein JNJ77_18700 [Planctomycetia bacterium]|nr:hypothetical protein [Planctomycetia bacterium]